MAKYGIVTIGAFTRKIRSAIQLSSVRKYPILNDSVERREAHETREATS